MSRKLFSLIAGLLLVLGLGVVPSLAQAEEGGTILGTVYEENGEDPPATPIAGVHVVAWSLLGWIVFCARSDKGDWDLFLCRPDGSESLSPAITMPTGCIYYIGCNNAFRSTSRRCVTALSAGAGTPPG